MQSVKIQSVLYVLCSLYCVAQGTAQDQAAIYQFVSQAPTVLTLTASTTSGQGLILLHAQVVGKQNHMPTGTVSFTATDSTGNTVGEEVALNAQGVAVWSENQGLGTYQLNASYHGDMNYLGSQTSQNISTPDFNLSIENSTVTVKQGATWNGAGLLTSLNGFDGDVTLSCGPLPELITCGTTTAHISSGGPPVSEGVNLTTVPTTVETLSGLLLLAGVTSLRRRRRIVSRFVAGTFCASLFLSIVGCGVKTRYVQTNGTPRGVYKINVIAVSGVISHSKVITLTVQ